MFLQTNGCQVYCPHFCDTMRETTLYRIDRRNKDGPFQSTGTVWRCCGRCCTGVRLPANGRRTRRHSSSGTTDPSLSQVSVSHLTYSFIDRQQIGASGQSQKISDAPRDERPSRGVTVPADDRLALLGIVKPPTSLLEIFPWAALSSPLPKSPGVRIAPFGVCRERL